MKIINPQVELWLQDDPIAHVAKCARVCYGSKENKSTYRQLYDNLLKAKHNSMFRHESVYAIIPIDNLKSDDVATLQLYENSPYIDIVIHGSKFYIATNGNFIRDYEKTVDIIDIILDNQVTPEYFANTEVGHSMMRYTFHITTQISTSRELNRVSPNNIAERSTRYVDESDGVIVRPHWMSEETMEYYNSHDATALPSPLYSIKAGKYLYSCWHSFKDYKELLEAGMKRQDARGVLPLDTATEVIYTYSVQEWKHIIELRSDKRAHPNCQIIANMIKGQLEQLGYAL